MRDEVSTDPNLPIQKKVLHAGKGVVPEFMDGTKVVHLFNIQIIYRLAKGHIKLNNYIKWFL